MVKPPCCNAKKDPWTEEEDAKIMFPYTSKYGTRNWTSAPRKAESSSGLKRCGKSCKLRWTNYLKPDLKHESFTPEEEELIIKLHAAVGSRWPAIAQQLPGRTDNDIKNHWNSKLKKKLTEMGIDPVTHKPFSQILAEYGNIGALPRAAHGPRYIPGTIRSDFKKHTLTSFTTPQKINLNNSSLAFPNLNNYPNPSHSLDLLSQLQAITLVTEGSSVTAANYGLFSQMPSPNSSSTSACSSSYNVGRMAKSPESFSWHEFLLDPAPNQLQEQQDNGSGFSLNKQFEIPAVGSMSSEEIMMNGCDIQRGSSSSTSSDGSLFLEAMLDQENDVFLNFPGLMDEPLY